MTRCLLRSIITTSGVDSEALYLQNAEVYVFRTGTTTTPVMYAAPTGGSPLTNPIVSDGNGEIDVWLDPTESNIIDIRVDSNGGNAYLANQPSKRQGFTTFTKTLQAGGPQGVPGGPGPQGPGVPAAGTTSQALVKASGTDFDTAWHTLTAVDVGAVAKSGDTMTGHLVVPDAVLDSQAPSFQQVPGKILASAVLTTPLNNGCEPLGVAISPELTDVPFTVPATGVFDVTIDVSCEAYGLCHFEIDVIIGPVTLGNMIPQTVSGGPPTGATVYCMGRIVGGGAGQAGGTLHRTVTVTGTPGTAMKATATYAVIGYSAGANLPGTGAATDIAVTSPGIGVSGEVRVGCPNFYLGSISILERGLIPSSQLNRFVTSVVTSAAGGGYPAQIATHPIYETWFVACYAATGTGALCTVDPWLGKIAPYKAAPGSDPLSAILFRPDAPYTGYAASTPASGGTVKVTPIDSYATDTWQTSITVGTQPAGAWMTRLAWSLSELKLYVAWGQSFSVVNPATASVVTVAPGKGNVNDVAVSADGSMCWVATDQVLLGYTLPITTGSTPAYTIGSTGSTDYGAFASVKIGPRSNVVFATMNGTVGMKQGWLYAHARTGVVFDKVVNHKCYGLALSSRFDIIVGYGTPDSANASQPTVTEWFGGSLYIRGEAFWAELAQLKIRSAR